ncbi:hypothetical protein ACK8GE_19955 [Micromonosporaceae bacterium DT194]|uniref:hypothetical protein n=1 Tax=Melissospora conviva TaxID=3388432 RepID=UPI003C24DD1F
MAFFASLLPGVRDFRTPMTAGLLWAGVLVIILAPRADELLSDTPEAAALAKLFSDWSISAMAPLLLAGAFLIGSIATAITHAVCAKVGKGLHGLVVHLDGILERRLLPYYLSWWSLALKDATDPISHTARALISDSIKNILTRAGAPASVARYYTLESVTSSIGHSAAHLSITAPPLYQDYDRFRSEAEFRIAIVVPLTCLSAVAPVQGKPLLVTTTIVGCGVLLAQAISQIRAANNILANAAYHGHAALVSVQQVADRLKDKGRALKTPGAWAGAMISTMERCGQLKEARAATGLLASRAASPDAYEGLEYLEAVNSAFHQVALIDLEKSKDFALENMR